METKNIINWENIFELLMLDLLSIKKLDNSKPKDIINMLKRSDVSGGLKISLFNNNIFIILKNSKS